MIFLRGRESAKKEVIITDGPPPFDKQAGSPTPELNTPSNLAGEIPQAIRLLYGASIGRELLHATAKSEKPKKSGNMNRRKNKNKRKRRDDVSEDEGACVEDMDDREEYDSEEDTEKNSKDDPESWVADAHFTNGNYQGKKTVFLLFINRQSSSSPFGSVTDGAKLVLNESLIFVMIW